MRKQDSEMRDWVRNHLDQEAAKAASAAAEVSAAAVEQVRNECAAQQAAAIAAAVTEAQAGAMAEQQKAISEAVEAALEEAKRGSDATKPPIEPREPVSDEVLRTTPHIGDMEPGVPHRSLNGTITRSGRRGGAFGFSCARLI